MKKKSLIFTFIFLIFISGLSIAYAAFTQRDYTHNSTILLGDIKVKYKDNSNYISLTNALPESTSKGRNHETTSITIDSKTYDIADNETIFTIDGKNTYRDNLYYRISLKYGEDLPFPEEMVGFPIPSFRLNDLCLRFDLIKYDSAGTEEYLLNNVRYSDLNNAIIYQGIFYPEIDTTINNVYKLRVWLSEDTNVSISPAGEMKLGLNISQNLMSYMYANFKITVESDLTSKEITKPFEYEILDYIEADDDQYIDTEYQITSDEMVFTEFEITEFDSNRVSLFGATKNSDKYGIDLENRAMYSYLYGTPGELDHYLYKTKNKYNVIHSELSETVNLYNNNETNYGTNNTPPSTINYGNLYIFKSSGSQTNSFKGKIYSFGIIDQSMNVLRDYIPVRNVDGEIGLYELKEGEFFASESSNSFTGPQKESIFVGNGTKTDPYLIRGKSDLNNLFSSIIALSNNGENIAYQNNYFLMTNDAVYDGTETIDALGDNRFGGVFDGDGYKIVNLKSIGDKLGVFGTLTNGTIQNLTIENGQLTQSTDSTPVYMGGLTYINDGGTIQGNFVDIDYIGNGTKLDVCALAGATQGESFFYANFVDGTVTNCGNGVKYAGSKAVSGKAGTYNNLFSLSGSPFATSDSNNKVVGYNALDVVLNDEKINAANEFTRDNNLNCFELDETTHRPVISHDTCPAYNMLDLLHFNGNGTSASPYQITNKNDFVSFLSFIKDYSYEQSHPILEGIYFDITNNIVFDGVEVIQGLSNTDSFGGILNGRGHYIKNIKAEGQSIFGSLTNGTIKNLGIINGSVIYTGTEVANHVTGFVRRMENSTIQNVFAITDINAGSKGKDVEGMAGFIDLPTCKFDNGYYAGTITYGTTKKIFPFGSLKSNAYITISNFSYSILNQTELTSLGATYTTHGTSKTEAELKSQTMVNALNTVATAKGYNQWTLDPETGYPIQIPN